MTITETSMAILELQRELKQEEEIYKEKTDPKKHALDTLKGELIDKLTEQGLKSIKTADANFAIASRKGYSFNNEIEAMKWATKHKAVSIDKRLMAQKLKDMEKLPAFVKPIENNYLTIKETNKK